MTKASVSSTTVSTTAGDQISRITVIFCAKNQNNSVAKIYNVPIPTTKYNNFIILAGIRVNFVKITISPKRMPTQKTIHSNRPVLSTSFAHSRMMTLKFLSS